MCQHTGPCGRSLGAIHLWLHDASVFSFRGILSHLLRNFPGRNYSYYSHFCFIVGKIEVPGLPIQCPFLWNFEEGILIARASPHSSFGKSNPKWIPFYRYECIKTQNIHILEAQSYGEVVFNCEWALFSWRKIYWSVPQLDMSCSHPTKSYDHYYYLYFHWF